MRKLKQRNLFVIVENYYILYLSSIIPTTYYMEATYYKTCQLSLTEYVKNRTNYIINQIAIS